jgi:hypothetical protein
MFIMKCMVNIKCSYKELLILVLEIERIRYLSVILKESASHSIMR